MMTMQTQWTPDSWREKPILQQPKYPDERELDAVCNELRSMPPLVFASEVDQLRKELTKVAAGKGFLLQGGDCAESFSEFSEKHIRSVVRVLLQMAVTLTFSGKFPVVKMGRMAGQFAKPRSGDFEQRDGEKLPSYRGDSVNGACFNEQARLPDPQRLVSAYHQSATTMNLLRGLTQGGYASLRNVREWSLESLQSEEMASRYGAMAERIHQSLDFMEACGLPVEAFSSLDRTALYTSHEALLLNYESTMLRQQGERWYDLSAHFLWIGERTRQMDHAHVEFLRGVSNPIGVKIGPTATAEEVEQLLELLDPRKEEGKLVLIMRVGAEDAYTKLHSIFSSVKLSGRKVVWMCDPMHGNTIKSSSGYKTREFDAIYSEVKDFFRAHKDAGTWPGGLHLEMTGRNVTECTGGALNLTDEDLLKRYETHCDPRLNASQALELAYLVAGEMEAMASA